MDTFFFKRIKTIAWVIILSGVAFMPLAFTQQESSYFEISKNLDIFATLFKELNTYYVDEVQPSELMRKGIDGMLESLDPYTNYISEAEIEDYRLQTTGKYGGIGAVIRRNGDSVFVAELYETYAADKAGLKVGDKILEIDGNSANTKDTEEISKLLKGQAGTTVKLKIARLLSDGSERISDLVVTREDIKIKNVPYFGMVNDHIAYIRLSNFTENAGKEVKDALEELKSQHDVKGVILDVRGNPGGLLNEAVNIVNVFVPKGQEVVFTKGKVKEWDKPFKTLNAPVDISVSLVVLTDRGSASASEIVSGALQDLDRAVIIGQKTFGKGLVQTTRSLTYNTKLKVTTAKYYIPSGRCIQAINYAERLEDGSVGKIPDSLKTAFKTSTGRVVYDGGGIDPDISIEPEKLSKVAISLLTKNLIFNYATVYQSKHQSIADAKSFSLTDQEYQEFINYLKGKDYDYTTESEELIDDLQKTVESEKYMAAIKTDLENLKKNIKHDKEKDIIKHKAEIKKLLEEEIIGRYYYTSGKIRSSFNIDEDLRSAIDVLSNKEKYTSLLIPTR
ncbi:MAG: S41 family peptidase [Chitinophagales bacterium]|nr:S41 family peptidase [Chitinophagales bacterium]